jgi:hypothetical protein
MSSLPLVVSPEIIALGKKMKSGCFQYSYLQKILEYSYSTCIGVKPLIHLSELRTYRKVVPFQEKSSFHFAVLWKLLNGVD